MVPALILTTAEKKIFAALPQELRRDFAIEAEELTFKDSDEKRAIRMRNMKVSNPALKKLQEQGKKKQFTEAELKKSAETIDLSGLGEKDVMELAFAWGPEVFTLMIGVALKGAKTADDMSAALGLTRLRHGLLLAFNR